MRNSFESRIFWSGTGGQVNGPLHVPYIDDLLIESKYDDPGNESKIKAERIKNFSKFIVETCDNIIDEGNPCDLTDWIEINYSLDEWAEAGALLTDESTQTGRALRKWFLAAVCCALLKIKSKFPATNLSAKTEEWLINVSRAVHYDYVKHRSIERLNNHYYWACFSIVCVEMLCKDGRPDDRGSFLKLEAEDCLFSCLYNTEDFGDDYLYQLNEVERDEFGAHYTNFAIVPLVFMTHALILNEVDVRAYLPRLKKLCNFGAHVAHKPNAFPQIFSVPQNAVSPTVMTWAYPYRAIFGEDYLYTKMTENNLYAHSYSQVGGNLKGFFDRALT